MISQFRPCNSETLDRLHMTYCMHMYGCELWNLNEKDITQFKVVWRKGKRRIWKIPPRTHTNLVCNITNNIGTIIDKRLVRFICNSINHSNKTRSNILRVKLLCVNFTFSSNFQYLSFKYGLTEADWYINIDHLMGKVRKKLSMLYPKSILCDVLMEFCAIRDNITTCDIASITDIIAMIEDICIH